MLFLVYLSRTRWSWHWRTVQNSATMLFQWRHQEHGTACLPQSEPLRHWHCIQHICCIIVDTVKCPCNVLFCDSITLISCFLNNNVVGFTEGSDRRATAQGHFWQAWPWQRHRDAIWHCAGQGLVHTALWLHLLKFHEIWWSDMAWVSTLSVQVVIVMFIIARQETQRCLHAPTNLL